MDRQIVAAVRGQVDRYAQITFPSLPPGSTVPGFKRRSSAYVRLSMKRIYMLDMEYRTFRGTSCTGVLHGPRIEGALRRVLEEERRCGRGYVHPPQPQHLLRLDTGDLRVLSCLVGDVRSFETATLEDPGFPYGCSGPLRPATYVRALMKALYTEYIFVGGSRRSTADRILALLTR